VPFTVEVRERPQPQPRPQPQTGFIAGTVTNADGAPIEGAQVSFASGANAISPNPRRPFGSAELPVSPPIAFGAVAPESLAAGDQDPAQPRSTNRGVVTGPDGSYRLAAAPGSYLVTASADGYLLQWYNGAAGADAATRVEVKANETAAGIDFSLQAKPVATVSGVVSNANGVAVEGALVQAAKRQPASGAVAPSTRAAATTRTDAEGKYTLKLDPGTYAIGASMPALTSARGGKMVWWDGKAEAKDADLIELADGAARGGIDFKLP